jgi:hypothetical protein
MSSIWAETLLVVAVTCVASFFEERLRSIGSPILLNDKIRRTAHVCIVCGISGIQSHLLLFSEQLVRVLADIVQDLAPLVVFLLPSGHIVIRLLFLQAL